MGALEALNAGAVFLAIMGGMLLAAISAFVAATFEAKNKKLADRIGWTGVLGGWGIVVGALLIGMFL